MPLIKKITLATVAGCIALGGAAVAPTATSAKMITPALLPARATFGLDAPGWNRTALAGSYCTIADSCVVMAESSPDKSDASFGVSTVQAGKVVATGKRKTRPARAAKAALARLASFRANAESSVASTGARLTWNKKRLPKGVRVWSATATVAVDAEFAYYRIVEVVRGARVAVFVGYQAHPFPSTANATRMRNPLIKVVSSKAGLPVLSGATKSPLGNG
jgi:hypothetical protein